MRIAFFIQNEWAFGSIHSELTKLLYPYSIDASILDWTIKYTTEELLAYNKQIDLIVTIPQALPFLHSRGVSLEKCIVVFHSELDILYYTANIAPYHQAEVKHLGAVSLWLISRGKELGITRDINYLPLGVNYKRYYNPPSNELKTIGYAGIFHDRDVMIANKYHDHPGLHKRAYLIKEVAEKLNLNFVIANRYHNSYVTMTGFYPAVDCIMSASMKEGAGLPMLEGGAAGKLILTTKVGHFAEKITDAGAIALPFDEDEYKEQAEAILTYYIENPTEYRNKCLSIQEHAKSYDWINFIHHWAKLIKS
jgi:glycosyltransferase involved in cell wall biosynthesis